MPEKILDARGENLKISVGIGCKKGVSCNEIIAALESLFNAPEISGKYCFASIECLSSIDIKKDERGLLEFGKRLNKEFKFYSAAVLKNVQIQDGSEFVNLITGTYSVAEAAAILSSKKRILVVKKHKFSNITIAIAV